MTDSADLRFLLAIQDNGSLVATARALGLTPSAVSQRLQQLEKKLGTRLVDRTARSLRFTQEGTLLCERGAELIRQLDALSDDLHTRRGGLVGTLKVTWRGAATAEPAATRARAATAKNLFMSLFPQ